MNPLLRRFVPPLAAIGLIVAFVSLGLWQLERAAEKDQLASRFADDAPFRTPSTDDTPIPFERIEFRGRMDTGRQVLIDNIVRNSRIGYYVITPVELAAGEPLLLVNRGWIDKSVDVDIAVADDWRHLRGRSGRLPRVGIRSGEAFEGSAEWPRVAVYPTNDEVAAQLGQAVLPFVLLLDADDADGFLRDWQPVQSGPMMHYGYAFQWFAMALTVVAIAAWQWRRRRSR